MLSSMMEKASSVPLEHGKLSYMKPGFVRLKICVEKHMGQCRRGGIC